MILKQIAAIIAISLAASISYANDVYTNPTVGFSIKKPVGWVYLSTQAITENRKNVRLNDKELQEAMQKATAPLVVMARHPEPHGDLNATIQVVFRPLGQLQGTSPEKILAAVIPFLQKSFSDFTFVENIKPTKVSGLDAAFMKAKYTI